MFNDLPLLARHAEVDRHAYNAAFYELGLRWYWDIDTYEALLRTAADAAARVRHYLETCQAHLLRAYDAEFLVAVIQRKHAEHRSRMNERGAAIAPHFDWARALDREIGV